MSDQLDTIITKLDTIHEEMNTAMELLAIASPGKKDCSDELNEIIQAALPFVNAYDPHKFCAVSDYSRFSMEVSFGQVRRLIFAISKVTDGDLK